MNSPFAVAITIFLLISCMASVAVGTPLAADLETETLSTKRDLHEDHFVSKPTRKPTTEFKPTRKPTYENKPSRKPTTQYKPTRKPTKARPPTAQPTGHPYYSEENLPYFYENWQPGNWEGNGEVPTGSGET